MYYLLEKNSKGFYEVDGRDTRLVIETPGVVVGNASDSPVNVTFQIGEDTYFIEAGTCENGRIMEISRLMFDANDNVVDRQLLEGLEIIRNHPVLEFIQVSGASLKREPLVKE